MACNHHPGVVPIPFFAYKPFEQMNAALLEIGWVNGVVNNANGIDVRKSNLGSIALEGLKYTQIHAAKVPPTYLRFMNMKKFLAYALLLLLLTGSLQKFIADPGGVNWFANTLCVVVSGVSVAISGRPGMDPAFFNILVLALCIVSLAIAWGQWFVLGTGVAEATFVPIITGLIWRFRPKNSKNPTSAA